MLFIKIWYSVEKKKKKKKRDSNTKMKKLHIVLVNFKNIETLIWKILSDCLQIPFLILREFKRIN